MENGMALQKRSNLFIFSLTLLSLFISSASYAQNDFRERTPERKERYDKILDTLYDLYAPIIEAKGKTFKILRYEWPYDSLNIRMRRGYKGENGDTWHIIPPGGIFLHRLMNDDAFTLISCHEVGHHIGGAPLKRTYPPGSFYWSTTEGQADYFAASKCFRRFAEVTGDNEKFLQVQNYPQLDQRLLKKCQDSFSGLQQQGICLRTIRAGVVLSRFMADFNGLSTSSITPHTPDLTITDRTEDQHPDSQCRMDTYINGALCTKDHWSPIGYESTSDGACTRKEGYKKGTRPLCWFNPSSRYLPYTPEEKK